MQNILKKSWLFVIICAITICAVEAYGATNLPSLPDPELVVDGVKITSHYDDFYVYPTTLMQALAGKPGATWEAKDWSVETGSGTLEVKLLTGGGVDNKNLTGGYTFEDALKPTKDSFSGIWGIGTPSINGPVYVDDLVKYLKIKYGDNYTVPTFNFDFNETGDTSDYINLLGKVSIIDPNDGNKVIAYWSFDDDGASPDHIFDDTKWVTAYNVVPIPENPNYLIDNRGSGKLDYIAYAPGMNLADPEYYGHGYIFKGELFLTDLSQGGKEELFLGATEAPEQNNVPEPATFALFGLGAVAAAAFKRKTK
jgi:hypothetical protein